MKTIFTLLLLIAAALLMAQTEIPFGLIQHSSVDANGELHLRWQDFTEGMGQTTCFYNNDNGTWSSVQSTLLESGEMEALVPYNYGHKLRYRLYYNMDYMGESYSMLHAAYWDADGFPPNLNKMALLGTDAEGDSIMVYNQNLDLRESYMAVTQQKLYCSLKNLSGSFPTLNSLSSYNIYLAMISNPEAVSDSVAYAMVYSFNIPGLISSGLYKIGYDSGSEMPVFTRLGNIQSQVSSGTLNLACNFSDLTNDPDFGVWPNVTQSLMLVGATMAVTIDLGTMTPSLGLADYSTPAGVMFVDNFYQVEGNTLPVVSLQSWDSIGHILYLNYTDAEGDFPLTALVDPLLSPVVQAYPQDPLNPANSVYMAQLDANLSYDTINWTFSDNGMDMVTGAFSPSAVHDDAITPVALSCTLPNPLPTGAQIKVMGLDSSALQVKVYNLKGQYVGELYSGKPDTRELNLNWDGKLNGRALASGVYFIRLESGKRSTSHKFVILK